MLSKNKQKLIRLLAAKKHRDEIRLFIAEGPKVVGDLLGKIPCHIILGTSAWLAKNDVQADEIIEVTQEELERVSLLKTPRDVMAIFHRPDSVCESNVAWDKKMDSEDAEDAESMASAFAQIAASELTLALDGVQDPGNMGTIIRIADWFGIRHIFCSLDTADAFSPKTVMATMGAIARVRVHYLPLPSLFEACSDTVPVYGTFLDGKNIYNQELSDHGIIVMGNEGNGISPAVASAINRRLFIPSFPPDVPTSESLNVAIATAITCGEFRRRMQ